jgi:hypothetical protein
MAAGAEKIEARRIQEKPASGEVCGGKITAESTDVNNSLRLSLFLQVMKSHRQGTGAGIMPLLIFSLSISYLTYAH